MNVRKPIDYSTMYIKLDGLMEKSLPQMELYREIGRLICSRPEKGAAVMASEYLRENYADAAGFSPRNMRRMREFFRTYESNETLMAEAMKIGWTQNVLIIERCADDAERQWYLRAVVRFGWSKLELATKLDDEAHLKISFNPQEEVCYTANGAADAELSHKFAAVLPDEFQTPVAQGSSSRPMARGHPSRYRWNFHIIAPFSQNLFMLVASIATRKQLALLHAKFQRRSTTK